MMLAALIAHSAAAAEPPFSLGSKEAIAKIRETFVKDMAPSQRADIDPDSKFELYIEKPLSGVVLRRSVLLYRSEIVSEEINFKTPGPEPITEHETVRSTVPWALKWTESTLKRASLSEADHKYFLTEVPLYTATAQGWVAKLYRIKSTARLVVQKLGIPDLDIEEWVTSFTQKVLQGQLELEKAEQEKAAKAKPPAEPQPPFSLGSKERVAQILSTYKKGVLHLSEDKPVSPELQLFAEDIPFDPDAKPSAENITSGPVVSRKVILYGSEIVAEDIVYRATEPLFDCETVHTTVPWASNWTKGPSVKQLMYPSLALVEAPLYFAYRTGWVAKVYGARGTARLVVVKLDVPGLDIDDLVPGYAQKKLQKGMPQEMAEHGKAAKTKPPAEPPPPFSLGSKERVAQLRETLEPYQPLPPLDKPDSGYEFYLGKIQERGIVLCRHTLIHGSEIVAEETYFRAPGQEPITERETVRTIVPWASAWAQSTESVPDVGDPGEKMSLYTATTPGWTAKLYARKGGARLVVVKQGIPGVTIDDWMAGYVEKVVQKGMEDLKAEEEKAAKAKP